MLWIFNHCSGTAYHILCIYKQTACAWSFHSTVRLKEYIIMNESTYLFICDDILLNLQVLSCFTDNPSSYIALDFLSCDHFRNITVFYALSQLVGIKHDRKRTIILQFYLHISSEYASLHARNHLFTFADAVLIQPVSHIRLSCLHKRRTVALLQFAYKVNCDIRSSFPFTSFIDRFVLSFSSANILIFTSFLSSCRQFLLYLSLPHR